MRGCLIGHGRRSGLGARSPRWVFSGHHHHHNYTVSGVVVGCIGFSCGVQGCSLEAVLPNCIETMIPTHVTSHPTPHTPPNPAPFHPPNRPQPPTMPPPQVSCSGGVLHLLHDLDWRMYQPCLLFPYVPCRLCPSSTLPPPIQRLQRHHRHAPPPLPTTPPPPPHPLPTTPPPPPLPTTPPPPPHRSAAVMRCGASSMTPRDHTWRMRRPRLTFLQFSF